MFLWIDGVGLGEGHVAVDQRRDCSSRNDTVIGSAPITAVRGEAQFRRDALEGAGDVELYALAGKRRKVEDNSVTLSCGAGGRKRGATPQGGTRR